MDDTVTLTFTVEELARIQYALFALRLEEPNTDGDAALAEKLDVVSAL